CIPLAFHKLNIQPFQLVTHACVPYGIFLLDGEPSFEGFVDDVRQADLPAGGRLELADQLLFLSLRKRDGRLHRRVYEAEPWVVQPRELADDLKEEVRTPFGGDEEDKFHHHVRDFALQELGEDALFLLVIDHRAPEKPPEPLRPAGKLRDEAEIPGDL